MHVRPLGFFAIASCLVACKDPPTPPTAAPAANSASVAPSNSAQQLPDKCEVTIFPGDKVTTDEGEEKVPPGKPLGIGVEAGKTYCLGDKKLTPLTTLSEARAMVPPECIVDDQLGASHLVCRTIGLRMTFSGPQQRFAYFDLFAKGTDPFPPMPSASTSASATPIPAGCDAVLVPGVRVQFPGSAQDVAPGGDPVNGEPAPGKTYCLFGGKVTAKTTYAEAQKLAPKSCRLITVKGGWHLVCSNEGIRLSFGSADGLLFRYSLFTGAPDAGVP